MKQPSTAVQTLKLLSVTVAVLFTLGVVLSVGDLLFFGSSKIRPLFGMSADALRGDTADVRDGGSDGGPSP